MKTPTYKINPNFRLATPHLTVTWHLADLYTLTNEAAVPVPGRHVFSHKKEVQVLVQVHGTPANAQVDLFYHGASDFEVRGIQKWLRELFRDIINRVANEVLPARVRFLENEKGLHGKGAYVKRMRNSWMACCNQDNEIYMQPFLVLFRQEWLDEVILHEMAHYRHKHHLASFWKFLSQLLGRDAKKSNAQHDIELSPYYGYCLYLTKNR